MNACTHQHDAGLRAVGRVARAGATTLGLIALGVVLGSRAEVAWAAGQASQAATVGSATTLPAVDPATEIIKVVGQSDAATRRSAAVNILRSGSADGFKALLAVLTTENNFDAKMAVCQAIADTNSQVPEYIAPLQRLLESKEPLLRKAAAGALAVYTDSAVQARLATHRRDQERLLLVYNLRQLMNSLYDVTRGQADREALLDDWLSSGLDHMRAEALSIVQENLRREGAKPSANILELIRSLTRDPNEIVRQKLVGLLRDLGLIEDSARLRTMLLTEDSPIVREEIYKALGKLADPLAIEDCIAGLKDPSEAAAAAAADSLGKLCERSSGQPTEVVNRVVAAVVQRVESANVGNRLRIELAEAMAEIAAQPFAAILLRHAQDAQADPALRQAGVRGLGRLGLREHLPVILDRLASDTNAGVREIAAEAVGLLGERMADVQTLAARLDPKAEPVAAVQNQAWKSYQQVFRRLSEADQNSVLDSWRGDDPKSLTRRVELLGQVEVQSQTQNLPAERLLRIREDLGDAHLAAGVTQEAVAAWTRALAICPADRREVWTRLAGKIIAAQIKDGTIDKVLSLALDSKLPEARESVAGLLLDALRTLSAEKPAAAATLLDKADAGLLKQLSPTWQQEFAQLRGTLPTASAPATAPSIATQPAQ